MVEFRHHVAEERRCHISTMQQPSPPAYGQPSPHPLPASLKKKYPKIQTAFLLFFNKLYSILQISFFCSELQNRNALYLHTQVYN